jgi:hypothetical protein
VTGDGYPDLYFIDHDRTTSGIVEPPGHDLDDRLLVNDGNGYFTDSLTSRLSATMLSSDFGVAVEFADMNGDGALDVVKDTTDGSPQYVSIAYHDPANIGHFNQFHTGLGSGSPYHVAAGDLNNDNKLDLISGDDSTDIYRYNLGNDALGRATWGPNKSFQFLTGSDDGFVGNIHIIDLDADGWNDVVVADFDEDTPGCGRRCHFYHNPGGVTGSQITLREERQSSGAGWIGVVGMQAADASGTYDVGIFDLDNDGDLDMVMGRCTGTFVWLNTLNAAPSVTSFCYGDGSDTPCPCGNASAPGAIEGCLNSLGLGGRLEAQGIARVSADTAVLRGARMPNGSALYFQGTTRQNGGSGSVFGDGLRCASGSVVRLATKFNGAGESRFPEAGDATLSAQGGVSAGNVRTYQLWYRNAASFCNPETFNLTNGVEIAWAP